MNVAVLIFIPLSLYSSHPGRTDFRPTLRTLLIAFVSLDGCAKCITKLTREWAKRSLTAHWWMKDGWTVGRMDRVTNCCDHMTNVSLQDNTTAVCHSL